MSLTCEVSWPVEPDGPEHKHRHDPAATHLVTWQEKAARKPGPKPYAMGKDGTRYTYACCEEHAQAAQAWGNVAVYRLELVDEPG